MRLAAFALLAPLAASAQMTEADIWAKVVDKLDAATEQTAHVRWEIKRIDECIDGTMTGEPGCESEGLLRLESRRDAYKALTSVWAIDRSSYYALSRRETEKHPAFATFEADYRFSAANHSANVFNDWYRMSAYACETLYYSGEPIAGIEAVPHHCALNWEFSAEGWEAFNHAMYFMTWVLAIEHVERGPVITQSEDELLAEARSLMAHQEIWWNLELNEYQRHKVCTETWPRAQLHEIAAACDALEADIAEAVELATDIDAMLAKAPCGERYPCIVDGLDVHEFPGHAASYWAISPAKTEGDTLASVLRRINEHWASMLRGIVIVPAELFDAIVRISNGQHRAAKAWKFLDGVHYPLGRLVAREHERHH